MPITITDNLRDEVKAAAQRFNDAEEKFALADPATEAQKVVDLTAEMNEARRLFNVLGGFSATVKREPVEGESKPSVMEMVKGKLGIS